MDSDKPITSNSPPLSDMSRLDALSNAYMEAAHSEGQDEPSGHGSHSGSESESSFAEITTSALNSTAGNDALQNAPYITVDSAQRDDYEDKDTALQNTQGPGLFGAVNAKSVSNDQDPNSSVNLINMGSSTGRPFATPLKLLPPLKDIEHIVTPKSFGVAKDTLEPKIAVGSSPVIQESAQILPEIDEDPEDAFDATANDTFAKPSTQAGGHLDTSASRNTEATAAFLGLNPAEVVRLGADIISRVAQRAHTYQGIQSELSFFKLNQEHSNQLHTTKYEAFQKKLGQLSMENEKLIAHNESLTTKAQDNDNTISSLQSKVFGLTEKLQGLESSVKSNELSKSLALSSRDIEIAKLREQVQSLTESNVKVSQLVVQLTKELNEEANEKFQVKLELTKATNELTYSQKQKEWYSTQLRSIQDKYTELIKKHETEHLKSASQLSSLTSQNDALSSSKKLLESQVKELEIKHESTTGKLQELESKMEVQQIKYAKELAANQEMVELVRVQLQEREKRIGQLEIYAEELKESATTSIGELQAILSERDEKIAALEVKLKQTEEAFGAELQKDSDLPRISSSAETILNESNLGISLSALYTEFNLLKKRLVLEKSQKDKLASQLQHFVTELESKKPAIANYRTQVQFYEQSMKELLEKLEAARLDKMESEKECGRLRSRLANFEDERNSLKQLLKDLGRQLCYYLIHSNIRDGKDAPLTTNEKNAIDQILSKSGAGETAGITDTDILISERLVVFSSVIELQKKNEELLVAVRKLGRELEDKDTEANEFEAAAVEEAKDAILTLQSELDSVNIRLEAVTKERDLIKSLGNTGSNGDSRSTDVKLLSDSNAEYKARVKELDTSLKALQRDSSEKIRILTEKLLSGTSANETLKLQVASTKHAMEMSEARLANTKKLLESSQKIVEHTRNEVDFWKQQASKQESILVKKINDLNDLEKQFSELKSQLHNAQIEKDLLASAQNTLKGYIEQLRKDKQQLTAFVGNLQSLLEEREASALDLSGKLAQSIVNYQTLQDRVNEKEERIQVLSSQTELSLKAQNLKLEQVNELSQKLLETKSKLVEKELLVQKLSTELDNQKQLQPARRPVDKAGLAFDSNTTSVPIQEYEDLKASLRHAELQVLEFSKIARASEEALENATKTYEEYKESSTATLKLLENDKEELNNELRSKDSEIKKWQDQFQTLEEKFSAEISVLQLKIQEYSFKALSYDEMKADMDQRLESMSNDLKTQGTLYDNLMFQYNEKVSETELLNLQVQKQKDDIHKLSEEAQAAAAELLNVRNQFETLESTLKEKYSGVEEDLTTAKAKITDLEYQYNLALNQVELNSSGVSIDGNNAQEDLRQVVRFLRREKDAAEAKSTQLSNEVDVLKAEIESTTFELNATKAQISRLEINRVKLDESVQEHSRLMEQLQQLNILRESNNTLRNESKALQSRITELEITIKTMEAQAKANPGVADTNNAVQLQDLNLLKEENQRLKSQMSNNEDYKNLMQRFENLRTEFKNKLIGHRNKNKELEKELNDVKSTLETLQKELTEMKKTDSKEDIKKLNAKVTQLQAEKDVAVKQLTNDLKVAKQDYEKKVAELKAAEEKAADSISSSSGNFEEEKKRLVGEYEQKITTLNKEFEERLVKEKKAVEESIEKKCDFKLRVLNRKVERLEKAASTAAAPSIPAASQQGDENKKRPWAAGEDGIPKKQKE